jgi:hypothetical protein
LDLQPGRLAGKPSLGVKISGVSQRVKLCVDLFAAIPFGIVANGVDDHRPDDRFRCAIWAGLPPMDHARYAIQMQDLLQATRNRRLNIAHSFAIIFQ